MIDTMLRKAIAAHPDATVINIGAGRSANRDKAPGRAPHPIISGLPFISP